MAIPHPEALEALKARRSVRRYLPEQVAEEKLAAMLEAGTYAPTGMNRQSPLIAAVQDAADRDALSRLNREVMGGEGDPFYGAPTIVVVFADPAVSTGFEDACLVMGNLLNAAYDVGLGSCWIHRAKEVFETEEGRALMAKWGVPAGMVGVGHVALGYAADSLPAPSPRKDGYVRYAR